MLRDLEYLLLIRKGRGQKGVVKGDTGEIYSPPGKLTLK